MRTFENFCAQGDVSFRRVISIPETAMLVPDSGDALIVTHSETGHHHVMERDAAQLFQDGDNPLIGWLRVNRPTALIHKRPHDTHEPIMFSEGCYEVRRQREYVPDGFRAVAD